MNRPSPDDVVRAPRAILGAIGVLAGGEIIGRAVAFLAAAILARRLGPEGFGIIGFAVALCSYLALAVNSGLGEVGGREVARAPERAVDWYTTVASVRLVLASVSFVLLVLVSVLLPKPPVTQLVVLLVGLSFFSLALDPGWVFKGLERPLLAGAGPVLAQVVFAAGVWVFVTSPDDVTRVPVIQFAGELAAAAVLAMVLFGRRRPHLALAAGFKLLRETQYLTLARLLRVTVISADVVMLGFMVSDRAVGLYTAAYRVAFLLMAISGAVASAYLPSYARVVQSAPAAGRRLVGESLRLAVTIGAPLVAGAVVTAEPMMALLFGADYVEGATALRLLALSVGAVFIHWSHSTLFVVTHQMGVQAAIGGVAAAVNIALNVLLIPRFGIEGAAMATLVSEVLVVIMGIAAIRRMGLWPSLAVIWQPVAAALGMVAVLVSVGSALPLVQQIGLGGLAYASALLGLMTVARVLRRGTGAQG
ncbi:MAG TPA: oligosaccharide flippase family protein [Vicinamibacterales bacterium]|nr:oligosaccharide flippase family protein [Vicinamibacterales bacterium]